MARFRPWVKIGWPVEFVEKPVRIAVLNEEGYLDVTACVRTLPKECPVPMTVEKVLLLKYPLLSIVVRDCRISTSRGACTTLIASGLDDWPTPRRS